MHKTRDLILKYGTILPLALILSFALLCIGSYLIAGWSMRPIGDDYVWLHAFRQTPGWLDSLYSFFVTQNGRYAQNIAVAIPYGLLGSHFLKLVGIITISLFLLTCYVAIRAYKSTVDSRIHLSNRQIMGFSVLIFLAYSSLSVTYAYVKGNIDNSFQNILYYPGAVTYTFPFLLFGLLLSTAILYRHKLKSIRTLCLLTAAAFAIGLFGETVPALYLVLVSIVVLPYAFLTSKSTYNHLIKNVRILVSIGIGFIAAITVTYFSPAGIYRRSIVKSDSSLSLVDIVTSASLSLHDQYQLVFGPESVMKWSLILVVIVGFCIYRFISRYIDHLNIKISTIVLFTVLCFVLWATSLFISSALYTIGYQATGALTPPRFELLFNVWLALSLIGLGAALSALLEKSVRKNSAIINVTSLLLAVALMALTPHVFNMQTKRLVTVMNFSQQWDKQNSEMNKLSQQGVDKASVPLIDIGDGFSVTCSLDGSLDWLSLAKQRYYNIPHVCTEKSP